MSPVLNPALPFEKYFEEICQIPHGSYHEKPLSDYLAGFAARLGLRYKQYENGNVIICKAASPGCEGRPPVMLQAHMDMVCEKEPGYAHDFQKDPLQLYVEDGKIMARGTSLGADDGVGVAYMLAVLESDTLRHPPLECVFTVEEEVGCAGAAALRAEDLQSTRMIGLDDISGGSTTICSAGTLITVQAFARPMAPGAGHAYTLRVDGLLGGHSGDQIHLERANAIKAAARVLYALAQADGGLQTGAWQGGGVSNSIPRACTVQFTSALTAAQLTEASRDAVAGLREEYAYSDPGLRVSFEAQDAAYVYSRADSLALLEFLYLVPDGLQHRSMHLEGLTTSSTNLGILKTERDCTQATFMCRGASDSFIDTLAGQIRLLSQRYGWEERSAGRAPCWAYREDSALRKTLRQAFQETTGRELAEVAEHGGLECGTISRMRPEMDIVTLGPKVRGYHTAEEYLDRQSFAEIYQVLTSVLERL